MAKTENVMHLLSISSKPGKSLGSIDQYMDGRAKDYATEIIKAHLSGLSWDQITKFGYSPEDVCTLHAEWYHKVGKSYRMDKSVVGQWTLAELYQRDEMPA
jgi:hypothetical protein